MSKKIIKHELFEVLISAGTSLTQFPIPDLPNLRHVQLWGIQVYYKDIVPNSLISGKAVLTKADFQQSYLTLVNYDGKQFLNQAPLSMFQTIENNLSTIGAPFDASIQEKDFKSFTGQNVNYPKSFINVAKPIAPVLFDQVYLISVFYVDPSEIGKPKATLMTRR
jgi:hypothetical protein